MTTTPVRHTGLPGWPRPEHFTVEARHADQGAITAGCPVPGCDWTGRVGGHNRRISDLLKQAQHHIDDEMGD